MLQLPLMFLTEDAISEGKVVLDVKYFFLHVHSETKDLCDETSCPISGDFVMSHEQTLPSFTPPVRFSLFHVLALLSYISCKMFE